MRLKSRVAPSIQVAKIPASRRRFFRSGKIPPGWRRSHGWAAAGSPVARRPTSTTNRLPGCRAYILSQGYSASSLCRATGKPSSGNPSGGLWGYAGAGSTEAHLFPRRLANRHGMPRSGGRSHHVIGSMLPCAWRTAGFPSYAVPTSRPRWATVSGCRRLRHQRWPAHQLPPPPVMESQLFVSSPACHVA